MADDIKKVGIRLVAEDEASFSKALTNVQKQIDQTIQSVSSLAGSATDAASGGISMLSIAVGNILAQAVMKGVQFITQLIGKIKEVGWTALTTASRFQQMTQAAYLMGDRMGISTDEIQGMIDKMRAGGIQAEIATNLIVELARSNIDLSKATDLARVAQNAAVISNSDSSTTLQRLQYGIMTYNTLILRSAGIMIKSSEAFAKYGEEIGKTAAQLSPMEKQQAMLNAVIAEGAKIAGFYELSMENAGKVLGSIPRVLNDIYIALGEPFQKVFFTAVNTAYRGLIKLSEALSKDVPTAAQITSMAMEKVAESNDYSAGSIQRNIDEVKESTKHWGALRQPLQQVAALLEVLTENFFEVGQRGIQNALIKVGEFAKQLQSFAARAFQWGVNLIAQFAYGIVQGATSVLVSAMNFITRILTGWMAPGSPPKILPDIDKWGGQTMNEWLKGMTSVDFSVLQKVSSPIEQMLRAMGKFDPSTMIGIEKGLMSALSTGKVDQSLMDNLTSALGKYSGEVKELVTRQIELASALNKVKEAETALKEAREAAQDQHKKVSDMVREYNKLVKEGADKDILKSKRDEIKLEQNKLKEAVDVVRERESEYREAAKIAEPLQEAISLQEQQIQQMTRLVGLQEQARQEMEAARDAARDMANALKDAGGGAGGGAGSMPDFGDLEGLGMGGGLPQIDPDEMFDDMKEEISAYFTKMWDDLEEEWALKFEEAIAPLTTAWEEFSTAVGEVWEAHGKPAFEWFKENVIEGIDWDLLVESFGKITGKLLVLGAAVGIGLVVWKTFAIILGLITSPIFLIIAGLTLLQAAWDSNFMGIRDTLTELGEKVKETLGEEGPALMATFSEAWELIKVAFASAWEAIQPALDGLGESIQTVFKMASPILDDFLGIITDGMPLAEVAIIMFGSLISAVFGMVAGIISGVLRAISWSIIGITMIVGGVVKVIRGLINVFVGIATAISGLLKGDVNEYGEGLKQMFEGIKAVVEGMLSAIVGFFITTFGWIIAFIWGFVESVINFFKNLSSNLVGNSIIPDMVNAIIEWFVNLWNSVVEKVSNLVNSVVQFFTDLWTKVVAIVTVLWSAIVAYFNAIREAVVEKVNELVTKAIEFFTNLYNDVSAKVSELWTTVVEYFTNLYNDAVEKINSMVSDIVEAVSGFVDDVIQFFTDLYDKSLEKIEQMWEDIKTAVSTAATNLLTMVENFVSDIANKFSGQDWFGVGKDIVQGIIDGLKSMISALVDAATAVASEGLAALTAFFKMGSPSRLTAEKIGKPFAEGIAMGIRSGMHEINKAALEAVSGTVSPAMRGSAVHGGGNTVTNNTKEYNLSVISSASPNAAMQSFEIMEAVSI